MTAYSWHWWNSGSFQSGLDEFSDYLKGLAGKEAYFDAVQLNGIISSFALALCDHLSSEIRSLLALSKYGDKLPIEDLWSKEGKRTVVIPRISNSEYLPADFTRLQWRNSARFHSSSSISMLRMRTTCGRIGLRFPVLWKGPSLIVSRYGTRDIGSLPAVTEVGHRSLYTHQVRIGDLLLACCYLRASVFPLSVSHMCHVNLVLIVLLSNLVFCM